jgi:hypothetical protein
MTTEIKDYDLPDESGYGSHIPALKFVFSHIERPKFSFEYGMGFFSTPFLIDHSDKVFSLEMQDKDWYDKVVERYNFINWHHDFTEDVAAFNLHEVPDFLFVDGSSITRAIAVVHGMQRRVDTIMLHDTESSWYGYNMISQYVEPLGYKSHIFTEAYPTTTVYTKNQKLIDAISHY